MSPPMLGDAFAHHIWANDREVSARGSASGERLGRNQGDAEPVEEHAGRKGAASR